MKRISIVGVEGSGKSVLMAVLGTKFVRPNRDGLFLKSADESTFRHYNNIVDGMRLGEWPAATMPGTVLNLRWKLKRSRGSGRPEKLAELHFLDFAGEDYRSAFGGGDVGNFNANAVEELRGHVSGSDVLLVLMNINDVLVNENVLVDLQRMHDVQWLTQAILEYARRPDVKVRECAIVFTQADKWTEILKDCGSPQGALGRYLPNVAAEYPDVPVFAVSAVNDIVTGQHVPDANFRSAGLDELMGWVARKMSRRWMKLVGVAMTVLTMAGTASALIWRACHEERVTETVSAVAISESPSSAHSKNIVQKERQVSTSVGKKLKTGDTKTITLPGGEQMEMIYCAPGEYVYGEEKTPSRMDHGFWLGKYEVTQAQWKSVMGDNPSCFNDDYHNPVEKVSWYDCKEFIRKVNAHSSCGARLPTEREWEYACRAGTSTEYSWGDSLNGVKANCDGNYPYGMETRGPRWRRTFPVNCYAANPWGFYNMHGNVKEWCEDVFSGDNDNHVLRGGSWFDGARDCRSASRYYTVFDRMISIGFRLCCSAGLHE